ncbi:MAG: flagellar motor stator protein MotA [Deltaproteobacteria bacterium]|nr:flagellar motor stator protein MotA [Deltaproteobacteria bacterium]
MSAILSIIVVSASVFGGFAMAKGHFGILVQPSEYVVICGAMLGALIGYAPITTFTKILKSIPIVFKGSGVTKNTFLQLLGLLITIFNVIRKEGVLGIEKDLSDPHTSERFKKYPAILHDHHAMDLLVGSLRLFVDGVVNAFDLDKLMETEIETHHSESAEITTLLNKVADAAPGIGIVAAVLGIIITMGHIDGPPSEIGHHVAAALVGTFLGILISYGYLQPIAQNIDSINREKHLLLSAIRAAVVSFAGGSPPQVALEFARKAITSDFRPSNAELEAIVSEARKA